MRLEQQNRTARTLIELTKMGTTMLLFVFLSACTTVATPDANQDDASVQRQTHSDVWMKR
jgi:hypothetical protein